MINLSTKCLALFMYFTFASSFVIEKASNSLIVCKREAADTKILDCILSLDITATKVNGQMVEALNLPFKLEDNVSISDSNVAFNFCNELNISDKSSPPISVGLELEFKASEDAFYKYVTNVVKVDSWDKFTTVFTGLKTVGQLDTDLKTVTVKATPESDQMSDFKNIYSFNFDEALKSLKPQPVAEEMFEVVANEGDKHVWPFYKLKAANKELMKQVDLDAKQVFVSAFSFDSGSNKCNITLEAPARLIL